MKILKFILLLCFVLFLCYTGTAQITSKLPPAKNAQANEYKELVNQYKNTGNTTQQANYLNKLAYLYWEYDIYSEAIGYFLTSLELNESINNINAIQAISTNLGTIYTDIGQYSNANTFYLKALEANRKLNRKQSIVGNLLNLANVKILLNNNNNAISYLEEALTLSKELNNLNLIRQCYGMLGETYENIGNSKKAIEYNDLFLTLDKHIKKEEMSELQAQTKEKIDQAKAEVRATEFILDKRTDELRVTQDSLEQSERERALMHQLNEVKEAKLQEEIEKRRKERIIRWLVIFGLGIVMVFSFIVYQQLRQKRKANNLLAAQNEEIKRQKKEIEEQHNHISSGLRYAKTIQQAVLPIKQELDKYLDTFIIYQPKEIVSGDFYWFSKVNKKDNKLYLAVADCTGHGVPGAFMSLIGNRLISEVVNERKYTEPAEILENLNEQIKIALRQYETDNHDGMDLCFCRLEPFQRVQTKILFSGAKRPLFYYKKSTQELDILKGDRKSLGGIMPEWDHTRFTIQEIVLDKGDMIYLTSDGYVDQASPQDVRFGTKNLMQVLQEIAVLPCEEQKKELETRLEEFKEGNEQVDDITVIGIKI